jgi:hypothetical protein
MKVRKTLDTTDVSAVPGDAEVRKAAPDAQVQPYRERLEALIKGRYPRLLAEKITGTAMVTVLFDPDGTLARADLQVFSGAFSVLTASELQFARFGLTAGELRYIGVERIQLPLNTVLVVFGGRDSRDLDRALVERFFPKVLVQGGSPNEAMWILFDHEGRALRTGEEHFDPAKLRKILEARYPGIRTSDMTVTPILARDGRPIRSSSHEAIQLYCVWLVADSPVPGEK